MNHSTLHTNEYYDSVNKRLAYAESLAGDKQANIRAALAKIGQELENGTFK